MYLAQLKNKIPSVKFFNWRAKRDQVNVDMHYKTAAATTTTTAVVATTNQQAVTAIAHT